MKTILIVIIFRLCCESSFGAVFDPYTRRYNIRNAAFESIFSPSTIASNGIQTLVNASIQTLTSSSQPFDDRCKSIHQYLTSPSLENLVNFQYELTELCPEVFSLIRHKNISTWGPVEEFLQIWYMRFVDALWQRIKAITSTGKCGLWEDFICAAYSTSDCDLLQYLQDNYDPALCVANADTMYKWHQLILKPEIKNRLTNFLKVGSFSIQLVRAITKAYLIEARYSLYFEGPPFPLTAIYFPAILTFSNFTLTEKGFIKQVGNYYNVVFPPLNLAGRQNNLLMKHSENIDLSWSFFGIFNRVPLASEDEIFFYHLLVYLCQRDFLKSKQLQYVAAPATTSTQTICSTTTTTSTISTTTTSTTTTITTPTTATTTTMPTTSPTSTISTTATTITPTTTTTSVTTTSTPTTTTTSTTTTTPMPTTTTTTCSSPCCACSVPLQYNDMCGSELTVGTCDANNVINVNCGDCFVFTKNTTTGALVPRGSDPVDIVCDSSGKYYIGTISEQVTNVICN